MSSHADTLNVSINIHEPDAFTIEGNLKDIHSPGDIEMIGNSGENENKKVYKSFYMGTKVVSSYLGSCKIWTEITQEYRNRGLWRLPDSFVRDSFRS